MGMHWNWMKLRFLKVLCNNLYVRHLIDLQCLKTDLDGEGVIEAASSHGQTGNMCSSRWSCQSNCCERNRCVEKVRDWASIHYCPSECRGWPFAPTGTC